jgi:hypothetical protein
MTDFLFVYLCIHTLCNSHVLDTFFHQPRQHDARGTKTLTSLPHYINPVHAFRSTSSKLSSSVLASPSTSSPLDVQPSQPLTSPPPAALLDSFAAVQLDASGMSTDGLYHVDRLASVYSSVHVALRVEMLLVIAAASDDQHTTVLTDDDII